MTRIDFHSNVNDQLDYACRLVRKALANANTVMVRHQDDKQLSQFDTLLWTFSATDFLPHVVLNEVNKRDNLTAARRTPVVLTLASDTNTFDVKSMILINLSDTVPTNFTQFERLIEIVPRETVQTQTATQAGRERYRFYQQQGYQLNHTIAK